MSSTCSKCCAVDVGPTRATRLSACVPSRSKRCSAYQLCEYPGAVKKQVCDFARRYQHLQLEALNKVPSRCPWGFDTGSSTAKQSNSLLVQALSCVVSHPLGNACFECITDREHTNKDRCVPCVHLAASRLIGMAMWQMFSIIHM